MLTAGVWEKPPRTRTSISSNSSRSRQSTQRGFAGRDQALSQAVRIRSPYNLAMLERCLDETDPETTDVVVMTATVLPLGSADMARRSPSATDSS